MRLTLSFRNSHGVSRPIGRAMLLLLCAGTCSLAQADAGDAIEMPMSGGTIERVHDSAVSTTAQAVRLSVTEMSPRPEREYQLLMFHATWCGPCRQFKQHTLPQLGLKFSDDGREPICLIDSDKSPARIEAYQVTALPCYVLLHREEGEGEWRQVRRATGNLSADEFRSKFPELVK